MTKKELFQLLQIIRHFYEQFDVHQEKFDAWYRVMRHEAFEVVKDNLENYVKHSVYAPKVSDLLRKEDAKDYLVPNSEETMDSLPTSVRAASDEVVRTELAKIRRILGIERG